jgi:hypothetical protein
MDISSPIDSAPSASTRGVRRSAAQRAAEGAAEEVRLETCMPIHGFQQVALSGSDLFGTRKFRAHDAQLGNPQHASHSGSLDPRGTSTVLKEPGVLDRTTWSVIP